MLKNAQLKMVPLVLLAVLSGTPSGAAAEYDSVEPTIDSLIITGNLPISESDLLDGTELEEGTSLFTVTRSEVFQGVLANLNRRGYLDAVVSVQWPRLYEDSTVVTLDVDAGRRSLRGGLIFTGNTIFGASELAREFPVDYGDILNPEAIAEFQRSITAMYRERGYVRAEVEVKLLDFDEPGPDSVPGGRAIECRIEENEQVILGSIGVSGLQTVRKKVVVREIGIAPGDSLDMRILSESLTRIYRLGLFHDVRFEYDGLDEDADTVGLQVVLNERDYRTVDLGAGYLSPSAGLVSAYWRHPNIWGNNQRLSIGASYTRYFSSEGGVVFEPELRYEEPYFISSRWRGLLRLSYLFLELPALEERSYGVDLTFTRDLMEHLELSVGYGLERSRYSAALEEGGYEQSDWTTSSSVTSSLTHDTRSPMMDPGKGVWLRGIGRISGGPLGGRSFWGAEAEGRFYVAVRRQLILAGRLRGGLVMPYGSYDEILPADRYFLGGGSTIRGYGFNTIGPEDEEGNPIGGNIMILGNFETRIKLLWKLGVVLFVDGGGLWNSFGDVSTATAGLGTGMGLRFATPFGPLRVDYGFAPTWRDGLSRGRIYLALGHAF